MHLCNLLNDNRFVLILADIISCIEFSHDGELLATGDKGGRVVIFQRDQSVGAHFYRQLLSPFSAVLPLLRFSLG